MWLEYWLAEENGNIAGEREDVALTPEEVLDKLKEYWDKYKTWIILAIVGIVALYILKMFVGKKTPGRIIYEYE